MKTTLNPELFELKTFVANTRRSTDQLYKMYAEPLYQDPQTDFTVEGRALMTELISHADANAKAAEMAVANILTQYNYPMWYKILFRKNR